MSELLVIYKAGYEEIDQSNSLPRTSSLCAPQAYQTLGQFESVGWGQHRGWYVWTQRCGETSFLRFLLWVLLAVAAFASCPADCELLDEDFAMLTGYKCELYSLLQKKEMQIRTRNNYRSSSVDTADYHSYNVWPLRGRNGLPGRKQFGTNR